MRQIQDSLIEAFKRNRLVFWYDPSGEWARAFDSFPDESVVKLKVVGNEFGTKVRVIRDPDPETRFLIYIPSARPPDADNWLLDLLYQGYEFRADKASLSLQGVGLSYEFRYLAEEHAGFFCDEKLVQELKGKVSKDDQAGDIRLKMMAVLADAAVELDAILLRFLGTSTASDSSDLIAECFDASGLTTYFWREVGRLYGYKSATPSLRDFAVSLFRGANPLDKQTNPHPHAKVLLQRWKDSQAYRNAYREWAHQMERELHVATALGSVENPSALNDSDTFEIFEKFVLQSLCQTFAKGATVNDLQTVMQKRKASFWFKLHEQGYAALESAAELRELLSSAELTMDSLNSGLSRYVNSWWRIDKAYRICTFNLRSYGQVQVMEKISEWVEKTYVNNFLLPLTDNWSDQIRRLDVWECDALPSQRRFFEKYVKQAHLSKGQKVFVIISDALRYEAAMDFAQRLSASNRWTASVDAVFGSLPTYTQLGMASLLPGSELEIEAATATVRVNGLSASGIANRALILEQGADTKATAIHSKEFMELNSKTDGRDLMRDHEVIYIYHDHIDHVGDDAGTEVKTFSAVEEAFEELDAIIKKVANINGTNMVLTADHGFLFQQDNVAKEDMAEYPPADEWINRNRRFALGRGIKTTPGVKVFSSAALNLRGDWSAAFPLSLGRFPLQGSGKRFVHGGVSLQEVVVPVVKIHKARVDDTGIVEVELLRAPTKITTGQIAIALYQDRPAVDKVLPRILRIGLFAKDGTPLSEVKTFTFDSGEAEARQRETPVILALAHAADEYNNREVELRLETAVQGTNQFVIYKTQNIKIQKPFGSDFDEL